MSVQSAKAPTGISRDGLQGGGIQVQMEISEADANLKIDRWHKNSSLLIVDVSIGQFSIAVSGARVLGFLGDRLIFSLPTGHSECRYQKRDLKAKLSNSRTRFSYHSFSKGGSCYLQASEAPDPAWPKDIGG